MNIHVCYSYLFCPISNVGESLDTRLSYAPPLHFPSLTLPSFPSLYLPSLPIPHPCTLCFLPPGETVVLKSS